MNGTRYIIIIPIILFYSNYNFAQDSDTTQDRSFVFSPALGGQFEFTTLLYVFELGALVDIDLLKKESKVDYFFGTRLSYESYGYYEPGGPTGGGPFKDYCFYIMHSVRNEKFHLNITGGLAYHTKDKSSSFYPNETLFRAGVEFRYNIVNKMFALVFKSYTSFEKRTAFAGLGIAIGYYK